MPKPWYADDAIPAEAIRISEAFERALEAVNANPKILETLNSRLLKELRASRKMDEQSEQWKGSSEEEKREYHREKEATVFFRNRLQKKELTAYIRDPETGEILQLNSRDWHPTNQPSLDPLRIPVGISDHGEEGHDFLNPNPVIRGAYRPIFLWKVDFERWLKKTFGLKTHAGGRPAGSGSWQDADRALITKMHRLIKSKSVNSPNEAARQVASEARGGGTLESKQTRLAKRYRQFWSE